ncbi:hypothetical protein FQR65_LT04499 [Abscondita terminalis]|nr:hypothetical protein FQR65_LT04499 [Abscondita terminalis]
MGKTSSTSDVLKNILKDVSNVQNIIDDSKKLEKNCASIDLDNEQELKKFIEATKAIVENLNEEAKKIYQYFDSNYSIWDGKLKDSELDKEKQVNNNNDCNGNEQSDSTTNHVESAVNEVHTNAENDVNSRVPSSLNECNDKDDESISAKKDNENINDENPSGEQKLFIKCVDINKLINPDILPHLTSPKPLQTNCVDTVLIISDSDEEGHKKNKMNSYSKTKFGNKKTMPGNRNISKSNKKRLNADSDVDMPNVSVTAKRSNVRRKATKSKYKDISESESSSLNDSDSDSHISTRRKRNTKTSILNKVNVHIEKDKKLSCKCYVPLPRVKCEMLKANYLVQKEIDEVNRLTNLRNFRKRARKNSNSSISSSGSDKIRSKSKHKKKSKESEASDVDLSKENDELMCTLLPDVIAGDAINLHDKKDDKAETEDLLENILNRLSSDSEKEDKTADEEKESDSKNDEDKRKDNHTSESENDNSNGDASDKPKETEKKDSSSDKQEDDHKKEDPKDDGDGKKKKGSNWRKDKLLTGKLIDTDSEDELEKFKRQHEQAKSDSRNSPAKDDIPHSIIKIKRIKKKANKVIDSDSESDKKSSSEDESDKKKSSSSSSEEEEQKKRKKLRRIKRVNDSSDEDGDKSTRKTIRKVIANESLAESTKRAAKEEEERKLRILERQKKYNQIFDCDKPEDATIDKLVLDFNEESKKELLSVNEDLVKKLKPHQGKGVQFMWDACFESVERAKSTGGSGCILAHCMGLGKTLQVIALTHTLLINNDTQVSKVLVVCPLNTVLNWRSEYKKWLSDIDGQEIEVFELVSCKQNHREFVVEDWYKSGGVLIIGYDMFRNLTNPNNKRLKKKAREIYLKGLVNPGPDLVVCDEGHLLKNEKTNLSIAMNKIRTSRRIVLTGTPMQNNLKEYYCMVQFVKPNLLGTYKEYMNRFVSPITNGQYTDSTTHDINVMRRRAHVLHKLLDGVVQRKDYAVLMPFLPPKHEYVLFLTLTDTQIKLYQHYIDHFSQRPAEDKLKTSFLFTDFQEFQRICTHPRVLLLKSQENQNKYISSDEEESEGSLKDFIDDESDAKSTSSGSSSSESKSDVSSKTKSSNKNTSKKRITRTAAAASGIDVGQLITENSETDGTEWWRKYCNGEELNNIKLSSKLYLLFLILQECELIGDKLLVFSQSLYSLNIIEYFLAKIDEATQNGDQSTVCGFSGSWALGLDYFRLDGSSSCDNRATWCKNFNNINNPRARLFLISTRAGGLGINLVGANRVIIFDVSWNPSHDIQSIYRVYRFGQTKPCYIYRFVVWGTMEMKIYERQVNKQAISKRVIDEQQIDRHYNQNDLAELYKFDPDPIDQITPLVPKDVLLAELLIKEKDRIFKYHEHQSLLENKEDEVLNEDERKAAWEEFENEKTRVNTANVNIGWIRNVPLNYITTALTNIVQKDNPGWTKEQVKRVVPLVLQQLRQQVDLGDMSLFQRIVTEVKQMQQIQQTQLQEMYRLQQQQQQELRYEQFRNLLSQGGLGLSNNPNEIVELND